MYRFTRASEHEPIVFGAARPGYRDPKVRQWIEFMQAQNIARICCLLTQHQLNRYTALLEIYRQSFGVHRVCWAPIADFQWVDRTALQTILPFLSDADQLREKVVVHCSGGVGRTGQILAAWLIHRRGFSGQDAIAAVKKMGRNPYEAAIISFLKGQTPWAAVAEFNTLLDECHCI